LGIALGEAPGAKLGLVGESWLEMQSKFSSHPTQLPVNTLEQSKVTFHPAPMFRKEQDLHVVEFSIDPT
jgi:hypothetical protein